MAEPIYAAPAQPWSQNSYVVLTSRSDWIRHYWDRGALGEHVRWWLSADRPRLHRKEVHGTERIGGWPGVRVLAIPRMTFVRIGPLAELAGLLFTAWAVAHVVRHPRR